MLIIFNVSSANSAGAAASASSAFVKKPKAVAHALKSNAFLRVDTASSFSTSSFDVEEEHISRARIAEEEDTFFLIVPFLLAFLAKAFVCSREKPPDDFDDAPRREEERDDRDDGIVVFDAEKEAEKMFIACVSCAQRRERKKWINWKKFN